VLVIDQDDHASCLQFRYRVLDGVKSHGLNCLPLCLDCPLSPAFLPEDGMINRPVWHVDITRAASLSRENRPFRASQMPRSILVVDDVG
jgi:hypothetical protein